MRKRLSLIWLSIIIVAIIIFLPIIVYYSQKQQNTESRANSESSARAATLAHNGYIVEFDDNIIEGADDGAGGAAEGQRSNQSRENVKKKMLNKMKKKSFKPTKTDPDTVAVISEYSSSIKGMAIEIDDEEAEQLKELPEVKEVYPNLIYKSTLSESVPLIKADKVWQLRDSRGNLVTGKGINIAVLDTGLDYRNPAFSGKYSGGYDFVTCDNYTLLGSCTAPRPQDNDPMDDAGHGTHVSGISVGIGRLLGVAPDAKIISYKVLNKSSQGDSASILAAIDRVIQTRTDGNPSNDIHVVNMSLGFNCLGFYDDYCGPNDAVSKAVDRMSDAGIVTVVAAGNSGPAESTINSPGTARKAITVGSVNKNKSISDFSSRGPVRLGSEILEKPDVVAPGEDICAASWAGDSTGQTCLDNNYKSFSGTSMASPHVAGVAALIKQYYPNYSPAQVKNLITNNSDSLGNNRNTEGKGLVNVLRMFPNSPTNVPSNIPTRTPTKIPTNIPTKTPSNAPSSTPTPTFAGPRTALILDVGLPGIGSVGDRLRPSGGQFNQNPQKREINLQIEVYNASNQKVDTKTGKVVFDGASGRYKGDIALSQSLASGQYLVYLKADYYLRIQVQGMIQITKNSSSVIAPLNFIAGDINNDNSLTIDDYKILIACSIFSNNKSGCPSGSNALGADLTSDGIVDQDDYTLYLRETSVIQGK